MIEGGKGIADVDTLSRLRSIDLQRILEKGGKTELLCQLDAKDTILQHIGMKAKGAFAIEDVLDVCLLGDVVCHTFDGHNLLPAVLNDKGLPLEHRRKDIHLVALLESQQSRVFGTHRLPVPWCDAQFGVEGSKEFCHKVLESVEDTQGHHHRHCRNGNPKHRYATNDVDGMVALLGEKVASRYEEFQPSSKPSTKKEGFYVAEDRHSILRSPLLGEGLGVRISAIRRCAPHSQGCHRRRT